DITVTVSNLTDEPFQEVTVDGQPPYFVHLLDEGKVTIPVIAANSEAEVTVKAVALEGGISAVHVYVSADLFQAKHKRSFDITGQGFYGGDNHTHTKHSDGVHTVAENSKEVYENRLLSWVWSTDHNTFSQKQDADQVTASYDGRFLSLAGTEITTPHGH